MAEYTFSISGDITSGECCILRLQDDILASDMSQSAKDALGALQTGRGGVSDRLDVDFPSYTLSAPDETELHAVVLAHKPIDESGIQISRVSGFDEDGSGYNNVCCWTAEVEQEGDLIEYVPDSALGDSWLVHKTDVYTITAWGTSTSSGAGTLSINVGSQLTNTQIGAHNRALSRAGLSGAPIHVSWRGKIARGDRIWIGEAASYGLDNGSAGEVSVSR